MNECFTLRYSVFLIATLVLAGSSGPAAGTAPGAPMLAVSAGESAPIAPAPRSPGARAQAQSDIDPALLAGMRARSIGPAAMSGRVTAIDAVWADPRIISVGGASGGVWKTTNGGMSWEPIFDDQPVHSIGAIAIFQPNPDVIWVGSRPGLGGKRGTRCVQNHRRRPELDEGPVRR